MEILNLWDFGKFDGPPAAPMAIRKSWGHRILCDDVEPGLSRTERQLNALIETGVC